MERWLPGANAVAKKRNAEIEAESEALKVPKNLDKMDTPYAFKALSTRFVFLRKVRSIATVARYKARVLVRRFVQGDFS